MNSVSAVAEFGDVNRRQVEQETITLGNNLYD